MPETPSLAAIPSRNGITTILGVKERTELKNAITSCLEGGDVPWGIQNTNTLQGGGEKSHSFI